VADLPALSKRGYYRQIGYEPHPGQDLIHFTPARFKVVPNGRRWGKTLFGAREVEPNAFCPSAITGEPQLGWIVGPQYSDSDKEFGLVYDSLRRAGVDRDSIKFVRNAESGNMHIKTKWGFELLGKSAGHPESLVGDGLDFVLMVEAGRHKRRTWGQYIRPTLSDKRGWAAFTGVPEGKSEHSLLYALFQRGLTPKAQKRGWRSWTMPSWTNTIIFPGGRTDPEILDAEDDLTSDEFDRQYGAKFSEKTGVVMQEWNDEDHLGDFSYKTDWPLYMAVDYGFTNPFVVLWIQVGPWGEIRVIKEQRYNRLDTEEVAADIMATVPGYVRVCERLFPDPAEPDDTRTLERKLRIPAYGNTGGEIKNRLALIRRALKVRNVDLPVGHPDRFPTLQIDRSCTMLAWEMREGYKWPEHRSDIRSDSENPMDKDNHGIEALGRFFRGMYHSPHQEGGSFVAVAEMGN
jgi:hypothetical protein